MTTPEVVLHPLALISITQSATHKTINCGTNKPERSVGILLGIENEEEIIVRTSFEIPESQLITKMSEGVKLNSEVNKEYKVVGWYAGMANGEPLASDIELHSQIVGENKNGLFLILNISKCYQKETDKIPITFFVLRNELFVPCSYHIASVDVERIGINEMINAGSSVETDKKEKEGISHAIETLKKKVDILVKYLKGVENGTIQADNHILAKIAQICSSIPVSDNSVFREEFNQESNDAKLTVLMMQLIHTTTVISNNIINYQDLKLQYKNKLNKEEEERKKAERGMSFDIRRDGVMMAGLEEDYDSDD
ncbi:Mov34/MPN/PAD-1 family protein [Entamoeba histolytica HM-1:IMSS-B]|uniref:COP9 signalosome subunit, putative n=6 Tax=Entamoeba histolytica TaxID=5759 RepID=C4LU38_ENTH1|nr:COP9 signalosome subunit, putative [Entamoeba histolytica HM-1:IMSS]EMD47578.1 COP9 signalosome subunit, putative [Entamoeba histolytica KU27]EMH76606.1 Mov34/MPN/PAD-1 family protein [Entamoeba histolytica HM-1:IMSS-B]EMS11727.1 COP9 signalosome subunit [Entamoeba histolytica HM-3:IMSS]ENY63441.1 COP9 signalosome subunit, putative [Entamoeba histolytica HM-1:IMSS-A]GAT92108.1 mov34 mpn pad 1 family protein [Entamoeba histolytica]|eukprot:XP_654160.1 COP9 signalosome subunit, putative [Entamoeba histolytica HM-1:IMSS]